MNTKIGVSFQVKLVTKLSPSWNFHTDIHFSSHFTSLLVP